MAESDIGGLVTVSAKLPLSLVRALDMLAEKRGVSRSFLLRELVYAAGQGRVILGAPPPRRAQFDDDLSAREVNAAALAEAQVDSLFALSDASVDRRLARGVVEVAQDGAEINSSGVPGSRGG